MTRVRHSEFKRDVGFDLGRPRIVFIIWYFFKIVFFQSAFPWPGKFKSALLRLFGAKVGRGVYWKPRVNIHIPWKLELGDYCLIGEEVILLNFESLKIGKEACISQRAFLCCGNHDYRDVRMRYRNAPIVVGDGVWVGAEVFVAPGITIGDEAVVTARSVVLSSLPQGMVCSGNPCSVVKARWS